MPSISTFHYIRDRVTHTFALPSLVSVITERARQESLGRAWGAT